MFNHLVDGLPTASLPTHIHCPLMCDNVGNMPRVVCLDVGHRVDAVRGVVFAPSAQKSGQPQLPETHYVWAVLVPYGIS